MEINKKHSNTMNNTKGYYDTDIINELYKTHTRKEVVEIYNQTHTHKLSVRTFRHLMDGGMIKTKRNGPGRFASYPLGYMYELQSCTKARYKRPVVLIKVNNIPNGHHKNFRRAANVMYERLHNCKVDDTTQIVININGDIWDFSKDNLYLLNQKASSIYYSSIYKNKSSVDYNKAYALLADLKSQLDNNCE